MIENNKPAKRFLITDIAFPGSTKPSISSRPIITNSQKPTLDPMVVASNPTRNDQTLNNYENIQGPPQLNSQPVAAEPQKLLELPADARSEDNLDQSLVSPAVETLTDYQQPQPHNDAYDASLNAEHRPKIKKHQQLKAVLISILITILIIVGIIYLAAGAGLIHISFKSITNFIYN